MRLWFLVILLASGPWAWAQAQKNEAQPAVKFRLDVTYDQETGKIYLPLRGDGDWSKIADPFWMIKDSREKAAALEVAYQEKLKSNEKIKREYSRVSPNSCEGMYYGLFTDGNKSKEYFDFEGQNIADDFGFTQETFSKNLKSVTGFWNIAPKEREKLDKDFETLKKKFFATFQNEPEITQNSELAFEIRKRIEAATLNINPDVDSGFTDPITDCSDPDLGCSKIRSVGLNVRGQPVYNTPLGGRFWMGLGVRQLLKLRAEAPRLW